MLGSQGTFRKQRPWAESLRVPLLVRHPAGLGPGTDATPVDAPDWMPTLLSLCGADIPESVQGRDFSPCIVGGGACGIEEALLGLYVPFHEWSYEKGGQEYRGLFSQDYTYARTLDGPWLLYDNQADPFQLTNLVDQPDAAELRRGLDAALRRRMADVGDAFEPGIALLERFGIGLNDKGDIPIKR
jgi:arylsulfatase A-like enzyme